jgi:dCTP deaminase
MSIFSGEELRRRSFITPFCDRTRHACGLTYGVGTAGYDIRIKQSIRIGPGGFALASTVEHFGMPGDMLGVVHDKSTLARRGLAVQNTVLEPGWRGFLTIELSNHGCDPSSIIELEAGQPIAQIIFHHVIGKVRPYEGKYQDQEDCPVPAIFEGFQVRVSS